MKIKTTVDTADFLHKFGTTEATFEKNVKKRLLELLIEETAKNRLEKIIRYEMVSYTEEDE